MQSIGDRELSSGHQITCLVNIISSVLKSVFGIIVKIGVVWIKIFWWLFKKPFSDKLVIRYKCHKANEYYNNTNNFDRTDFFCILWTIQYGWCCWPLELSKSFVHSFMEITRLWNLSKTIHFEFFFLLFWKVYKYQALRSKIRTSSIHFLFLDS